MDKDSSSNAGGRYTNEDLSFIKHHNSCPTEIWRNPAASNTIQLSRHLEKAHGITKENRTIQQQSQKKLVFHPQKGPSIFNKEEVQKLVLCWLAEESLPFSTVDSRILPLLLSPEVQKMWPTAQQISRSLPSIVESIEVKVKDTIKVSLFNV